MTRCGLLLALCAALFAADKPTVLSREASLELQLIAIQEEDAQRKIAAVADLLRAPIEEAKRAVIERECKRASIAETETETCQLDMKTGTVQRVKKKGPSK